MTTVIKQGFLFQEKSSQKSTVLPAAKGYRAPLNLTLVGGLNDDTLRADAVYMLRVLAGQSIRGLPNPKAKTAFLETIQAEIKLKQGKMVPELLVKNSLMHRNCG